jgi:hypothetical protein
MRPVKTFWEQFDGSASFLERGFIEEGWTFKTAAAQFKRRYGQAAGLGSLRDWWGKRINAMGREEFLRRAAEGAARTAAILEARLRASGAPDLQTLAALLGDMVLNLGTALRLNMASGSFDPGSESIQKALKLLTALADRALKAGQAADRRQEHVLKLRALEQSLTLGGPAPGTNGSSDKGGLDRVISRETLEKIERELKLL